MLRSALLIPVLMAGLGLQAAAPIVIQPTKTETVTETRSLPLASGSQLRVGNVNGAIRVQSWDKEELSFTGTFKPSSKGEQVKVTLDPSGKGVVIKTEYPKHSGSEPYRGAEVHMELKVPRRLTVKLENVNGDLSLAELSGPATLRTVNGSIRAQNLTEGLDAESVNGGMDLEGIRCHLNVRTVNGSIKAKGLSDLTGGLEVKTVNGQVSLPLSGLQGLLAAHSMNGGITFRTQGASEVEVKRTQVRAKLGAGGPAIKVESLNGGITLE